MPPSLVSLYDDSRHDQVLCGSEDCYLSNAYYSLVRVEGYQPALGAADSIPMSDWWNQDTSDNWVDTLSTAPDGYTPADFKNGFVLSKQAEGTVPLYCYYNAKIQDHATVASDESIQWAKSNGYTTCTEHAGGIIGYVYTKPSQWRGVAPPVAVGGVYETRY